MELNHTVEEVTNQLKLWGRDLSATTQVKVLSPEIFIVAQGQVFHFTEANTVAFVIGENVPACRGLSPWRANKGLLTELGRTVAFHGSWREAKKATIRYVAAVVGPIHSRGVGGVMPVEGLTHSKGSAVYRKRKYRKMPYTEMETTEIKLDLIAGHAKRDAAMQFTSLAHLLNVEFLRKCFHSLNRNKAVGQDEVSWYDYAEELDENLMSLVERLKNKKFRPIPAKRVYIPKGDGKMRPIGISAIENKIVERGITWILESIYEQDFSDTSYGFRPGRSCHHALKELDEQIMYQPINHIVEADIKGFFDNVPHEQLLEFMKIRIKDPSLLWLVEKFLKAGYIDDGLLVRPDHGTPQGSILSPILANIYLHYVLDKWFDEEIKSQCGYCEIIRYADDFVIVVRYEAEAKQIEEALKARFAAYGLEIHPEKSRRFSFGRFERQNAAKQGRRANTFDFLGFTHFCDKTRKGRFKLGRQTSRKKFTAKCKDMNQWLKSIRNQIKTKDWWSTLSSKLRGHYQYYGVSGNYRSLQRFHYITMIMLRKWLNRRSQKKKMNWENYNAYLERYPLPEPKIIHNFYTGNPCHAR